MSNTSSKLSYDTKTIIVIFLFILFFPVGVILMWVWMETWPQWLKILITIFPLVFIFLAILLLLLIPFVIIPIFSIGTLTNLDLSEVEEQTEKNQQYVIETPAPYIPSDFE